MPEGLSAFRGGVMKTAIRRLLLTPIRFSVMQLFRMGQVGWAHWYDSPSLYPGGNHLYLYQDSAGTTPVTAVGQSVGLVLDRAYGGRTEASLLANGATGLTGTATAASYSTTTFAGSVSRAGDAINQSWVTWTGLTTSAIHRIRITNTGATSLDVRNGGVSGTIVASIAAGVTSYVHPLTSGGSTSITITATSNSTTATFTLSEFAQVPGVHRIQATSASRPLLMARVNKLLSSQDVSSASWGKTNTTATGTTQLTDTNSADSVVIQNATGSVASAWVGFMDLQRGNHDWVLITLYNPTSTAGMHCWFNLATGAFGTIEAIGAGTNWSADKENLGGGVWRVWVRTTPNGSGSTVSLACSSVGANNSYTRVVGGTRYQLRADLRDAADIGKNIPSYQRVGATASDHDTDGFPHGSYPDGTDDFDTSSTGGGGTTGFFFCGVLTVSGGAGTSRTIWSDTGTNTGYRVRINSSNKLELAAGNGTAYTTVHSNETITAPGTYLLSAWDDGGVLAVQVGNAAAATTTRPTVSAGTSAITSYRDNGAATSYFNGRDYGSVYRQSYPGETAHGRLKSWLSRNAGITV